MTMTQKLYDKAKDEGKLSELVSYLELAKKVIGEDGKLKGTKSTGLHKVKFISDRIIDGENYKTKQPEKQVEYIFEEDGENRKYIRPVFGEDGNLYYFIATMKQFEYGDILSLEFIKKGARGFIEILPLETKEGSKIMTEKDLEEEPVEEEEKEAVKEPKKTKTNEELSEQEMIDIDDIDF